MTDRDAESAQDLGPPGDRAPGRVSCLIGAVHRLESRVAAGHLDDIDSTVLGRTALEQLGGCRNDPFEVVPGRTSSSGVAPRRPGLAGRHDLSHRRRLIAARQLPDVTAPAPDHGGRLGAQIALIAHTAADRRAETALTWEPVTRIELVPCRLQDGRSAN